MYKNSNACMADTKCRRTLHDLHKGVKGIPSTDPMLAHYTKYAVIVCSGALERSFKFIVFDYVCNGATAPIKNYIDQKIVKSGMNPTKDKIKSTLDSFGMDWGKSFEQLVGLQPERNRHALTSLVKNRNSIAHGDDVSVSFGDVMKYYYRSRMVLRQIEAALN